MTSRKELLKAVEIIMEHCHSQNDCRDCEFFTLGFGCMFVDEDAPCGWDTTGLEDE